MQFDLHFPGGQRLSDLSHGCQSATGISLRSQAYLLTGLCDHLVLDFSTPLYILDINSVGVPSTPYFFLSLLMIL